jgi:hypothetical protein
MLTENTRIVFPVEIRICFHQTNYPCVTGASFPSIPALLQICGLYERRPYPTWCSRQSSKRLSSNRAIPPCDRFSGGGRAVIQPNFFPDTEPAFNVTGCPGDGDCSLRGLSTVPWKRAT